MGEVSFRSSRARRLRRTALLLASTVLIGFASSAPPVSAAPPPLFHGVSVQVGPAGQITRVTRSTVSGDGGGTAPVDESVDVAPADAVGELPVRVQTTWWADGQMGADLGELKGKSGRITIQVTVENLTSEPTEVAYEADGRRYSRQALVAVPLTVSASADVAAQPSAIVVTTPDGPGDAAGSGLVTDGVVSVLDDSTVSVQWARLLAPPLLSPTASFTLVVDAQDFVPPDFDIAVQPGLVADPSVDALIERGLGQDSDTAMVESSTIQLVAQVDTQMREALDFIDQVHEALQGDVTQISQATVAELEESSQATIDQLGSTRSQLESIQQAVQSGLGQGMSQTQQGMSALLDSLEDLLGSTALPPETVGESVAGCTVTLPQLAQDDATTLSSSVYLIDAQLRTLMEAFTDQAATTDHEATTDGPATDDQTPAPPNCRATLVAMVTGAIGDPADLSSPEGMEACLATPPQDRTVTCGLSVAETSAAKDYQTVTAALRAKVTAWDAGLGVDRLMSTLGTGGLATDLTNLRELIQDTDRRTDAMVEDLDAWVENTTHMIDQAKAQVLAASRAADTISAAVDEARRAFTGLQDLPGPGAAPTVPTVTAPSEPPAPPSQADLLDPVFSSILGDRQPRLASVGDWFADSGLIEAVDAWVDQANADTAGTCPAAWSSGLDGSSSAEEIVSALGLLADQADCPASVLAQALARTVTGYGSLASDAADTYDAVARIHDQVVSVDDYVEAVNGTDEVDGYTDEVDRYVEAMDDYLAAVNGGDGYVESVTAYTAGVDEKMDDLDEKITAVEDLFDDPRDSLPAALDSLYQTDDGVLPAGETGSLADLQGLVDQIARLLGPTGGTSDPDGLVGRVSQLSAMIDQIWPDDRFSPVTTLTQCPSDVADQRLSLPSGQAVVRLANRLYCANAQLGGILSEVDQDITTAARKTDTALQQASAQAGAMAADATNQIQLLSDQLAAAFGQQRDTTVPGTLAVIDDARDTADADMQQLLDQYQLRNDEVIAALTESMTAAQTDSVAAQQGLAQDFATLIGNLGGTDPSNRSGLIGKLFDVSGQVGQTGRMLATTQSAVASYGNSRSADMRDLALQAAQYTASQDRLADYHPFSDQADDAVTVFTFHLAAA